MPRSPKTGITTTLLTDREAAKHLSQLAFDCYSLSMAVAWATPNAVLDKLLRARTQWKHVVIGTHLYQTHPDALAELRGLRAARCQLPDGALFHPKVYLFEIIGDQTAAIVGSHNLTRGAMQHNVEASLLMWGPSASPEFVALRQFIARAWKTAHPVTTDFLADYRANYDARASARKTLEGFVRKPRAKSGARAVPESWSSLLSAVKPGLTLRLAVLAHAREWFARYPSFAAMPLEYRRAIAGMWEHDVYLATTPSRLLPDFACFGRMTGHGDFHHLVRESPRGLSAALDLIPHTGPVLESDYNRFVDRLHKAFAGATHGAGLASGSRLLALKRPDVFVPVNAANRMSLCPAFGVAATTTSLDNYWERIIAPMQMLPWWNASRPANAHQGAVWDGRAALLDALYYDP